MLLRCWIFEMWGARCFFLRLNLHIPWLLSSMALETYLEEEEGKFGVELSSFSTGFSQMSRLFKSNIAGKHDNSVSQFGSRHKDGICE